MTGVKVMSNSDISPLKSGSAALKVGELAKKVLNQLGQRSPAENRNRVVETSIWLANVTTTSGNYRQKDVITALKKRGISRDLVVDCCIPDAARILGDGWMNNLRSFGQVNLGAVRLQALLKNISLTWAEIHPTPSTSGLFLIVCRGEDHTLGSLILADQLRRRGFSISLLLEATENEVIQNVQNGEFDGIMISCSGIRAFDGVVKLTRGLKKLGKKMPPLVLGGAIIDVLEEKIHDMVDVDLLTKDVEEAIRFLKSTGKPNGSIERAS